MMKCLKCGSNKLVYDTASDAYICQDCEFKHEKQYFFISHSHLDIEKVRIVRNVIEETFFFEPILFFLKCLSDENEITSLIKREIYERIWFVYCDSANAQNSEYVKKEREYVDELVRNGKKINIINIALDKFNIWDKECYDHVRKQVEAAMIRTKVFISYDRKDKSAAIGLINMLKSRGFSVLSDKDVLDFNMDPYAEKTKNVIRECCKYGITLLFVTRNFVNSPCLHEAKQIFDNCTASGSGSNGIVLPIFAEKELYEEFVADPPSSKDQLKLFRKFQALLWTGTDDDFEKLVCLLKTAT